MEFPNLNDQLNRYRVAIERIHQAKTDELTLIDRLEPLLARDAIQSACTQSTQPTAHELAHNLNVCQIPSVVRHSSKIGIPRIALPA